MRQRVFLKSSVRENRTPEPVLSLSKESVRGLLGNWQSYRDGALGYERVSESENCERGRTSEFPVLRTERLVLREFRRSDAQAVFEIFSQDAVTRYHNVETMQSIEQAEELVEARASLFKRGLGVRWGVVLKERGDGVIGSCGYYNLNQANRCVEIGYDLHPAYWRQGVMNEALRAAIDYGFSEEFCSWLNRIEALTYVEHEASAGLLRKLGFQEEGIRREYGYWKGESHDLRSFSLLRRDWAMQGVCRL